MILSVRKWLIRTLAGRDVTVLCNLSVTAGGRGAALISEGAIFSRVRMEGFTLELGSGEAFRRIEDRLNNNVIVNPDSPPVPIIRAGPWVDCVCDDEYSCECGEREGQ